MFFRHNNAREALDGFAELGRAIRALLQRTLARWRTPACDVESGAPEGAAGPLTLVALDKAFPGADNLDLAGTAEDRALCMMLFGSGVKNVWIDKEGDIHVAYYDGLRRMYIASEVFETREA